MAETILDIPSKPLPDAVHARLKETGQSLTEQEIALAAFIVRDISPTDVHKHCKLTATEAGKVYSALINKLDVESAIGVATLFSTETPNRRIFDGLTECERHVTHLISQEFTVSEISQKYKTDEKAIRKITAAISRKTGAASFNRLAMIYVRTFPEDERADFITNGIGPAVPSRALARLAERSKTLKQVEIEIGLLIAAGTTRTGIAKDLSLTSLQVRANFVSLTRKLGIKRVSEVAALFSTAKPRPDVFIWLDRSQRELLDHVSSGMLVKDAAEKVGRSTRAVTKISRYLEVRNFREAISLYKETVPENLRAAFVESGINACGYQVIEPKRRRKATPQTTALAAPQPTA